MLGSDTILRLQLCKRQLKFIGRVTGHLAQKGQRKARLNAIPVARQYVANLRNCAWKFLPRGKVVVNMHFDSGRQQFPALHNLVKYYLDPLKGIAFKDDRQVHCLMASCLRLATQAPTKSQTDDSVYVTVERLTDYKLRFGIYFSLLSDSRFDHLTDSEDDRHDDLDDAIDRLREAPEYEKLGFSPKQVEAFRRLDMSQFQEKLLRINRVTNTDCPGTPLLAKYFPDSVAEFRELEPFSIDLGDLPRQGESKQYEERIRTSIQSFKSKRRNLREIIVPVELDVQVTPRALHLGKDLDNIMRDICPVIQDELLRQDAYVHGYRAYVTNKLKDDSPGSIRVKLLPQWGIGEFESAMDDFLNEVAYELD